MDILIQDVRFALRMLRKARGASVVAILSLALGISVNTTVFSWVRGILLNPVPGVAHGDRLVTIETVTPSGAMIDASYPDFQDYRDRSRLVDGVVAFKERPLGLGEDTRTERVWAMMVSGNYFDVLGVKPALGRFFAGDEQRDTFDSAPVAVLSDALWKGRFNASPRVVGQTVRLNRRNYTVIGVAPEGFYGTITGLRFDLYVPLTMQASLTGNSQWLSARDSRALYLFAQLKPGVSIDQARAEVRTIADALGREFPRTNKGLSATMLALSDARRGAQSDLGALLRILLALGACVLLIVCANLTNLQLARATTRQREIAVRLGLGASRPRLVRQLLTESLVISLLAGASALLLTSWMVDFLKLLVPFIEYPIVLASSVGARELAFATAASVVSALLVGIVPALRLSGGNIAETLKSGGHQTAGDSRTGRFRAGLVVGEVALAMVALVSAGLLVRSFENARRVNPGFEPRGVLLAGINLSTGGYDRERGLVYIDEARRRVRALPGVDGVTVAEDAPLGFSGGSWEDLTIEGYAPAQSENMKIYRNLVAPQYFDVMRIGMLEGRDFTDEDRGGTMPVAIVNREFARRYFEGRSPIGPISARGAGRSPSSAWWRRRGTTRSRRARSRTSTSRFASASAPAPASRFMSAPQVKKGPYPFFLTWCRSPRASAARFRRSTRRCRRRSSSRSSITWARPISRNGPRRCCSASSPCWRSRSPPSACTACRHSASPDGGRRSASGWRSGRPRPTSCG